MHRVSAGLAMMIFAALLSGNAAAGDCAQVRAAIDAQVTSDTPAPVLLDLGPHFSPKVLEALLALGRTGPFDRRLAAYGAFGLARHADGLRLLRRASAPRDPEGRLAHALAGLALGANTGTGTVSAVLASGSAKLRRGALWVLARMKHVRPRRLMRAALQDPDPEARLQAAEVLIHYRSRRARNALLELATGGPPPLAERAVEALIFSRYRFEPVFLRRMDPDRSARAIARSEAGRRAWPDLEEQLNEKNDGIRAGVMAMMLMAPEASESTLLAACKDWERRFGVKGMAELAMATALLGNHDAADSLSGLFGEPRAASLRVLSAFAGIRRAATRVDTGTAERIVAGLETWWPGLDDDARAILLASLAAVDAPTGVRFTRRILPTADGRALVAAADVLRRHGSVPDARALLERTTGPKSLAHGPVLDAAARLCRLEGR